MLRIRELRLAKPCMALLASGTRVLLDMEEWISKTSGHGLISIGIDHEDGNEPEELVNWRFLVGSTSYMEAVSELFAWADIDVHEETYDEAEYDRYEAECSVWDEGSSSSLSRLATGGACSSPAAFGRTTISPVRSITSALN